MEQIKPGLSYQQKHIVGKNDTAKTYGSGSLEVYATPAMVAFMENTALKTVEQDKGDITRWLEYFTDGVLYSIDKVKEVIEKIGFMPNVNAPEQIELTTRQIKILEEIKNKGKITNRELQSIFEISRQAILKEMLKLIGAKLIKLAGKGRGAYYKLSE